MMKYLFLRWQPRQRQLANNINHTTQNSKKKCRYCKKPGHVNKECRIRNRKEQEQPGEKLTIESPNAKTYRLRQQCQRSNHTTDMCCNRPNAANRSTKNKTQNQNDSTKVVSNEKISNESSKPGTSSKNAQISSFKNILN